MKNSMRRVDEARDLREKIDSLTERYNELVKNIRKMGNAQIIREFDTDNLKKQIEAEISRLREIAHKLEKDIQRTEKEKRDVTSEFKTIVKKDQYKKLQNRIDRKDFENRVTKDQFVRDLKAKR